MKHKFLAGALAAVLSLSLGTIGAQAHCVRHWTCAHPHGECVRCTDRNQDGLCDVCGAQVWFVDADGDGLCDHCGYSRFRTSSRYSSGGYSRRGGCHGRSHSH